MMIAFASRSDQSQVSVSIGGSSCPIDSFSSSKIECVTEACKPSVKAKVEVSIGDNGIAKQVNILIFLSSELIHIDKCTKVPQ